MTQRLIRRTCRAVTLLMAVLGPAWLPLLSAAPAAGAPPPGPKDEARATLAALEPPKYERPSVAVIGINDVTETTGYLMPYGIPRRACVAEVVARDVDLENWDASHDDAAVRITGSFALTAIGSRLGVWNYVRLGLELAPGMDEVSLAPTLDAWPGTYRARGELRVTAAPVETPDEGGARLPAKWRRLEAAQRAAQRHHAAAPGMSKPRGSWSWGLPPGGRGSGLAVIRRPDLLSRWASPPAEARMVGGTAMQRMLSWPEEGAWIGGRVVEEIWPRCRDGRHASVIGTSEQEKQHASDGDREGRPAQRGGGDALGGAAGGHDGL